MKRDTCSAAVRNHQRLRVKCSSGTVLLCLYCSHSSPAPNSIRSTTTFMSSYNYPHFEAERTEPQSNQVFMMPKSQVHQQWRPLQDGSSDSRGHALRLQDSLPLTQQHFHKNLLNTMNKHTANMQCDFHDSTSKHS